MIAHTFAANLKTIQVYRQSTASSNERGTRTAAWTLSHSITLVDVQPVMSERRRMLEGSEESAKYQCFGSTGVEDIENGDRVIDPINPGTTPTLEVFNVEKWPPVSGIPGHSRWFLRKVSK